MTAHDFHKNRKICDLPEGNMSRGSAAPDFTPIPLDAKPTPPLQAPGASDDRVSTLGLVPERAAHGGAMMGSPRLMGSNDGK